MSTCRPFTLLSTTQNRSRTWGCRCTTARSHNTYVYEQANSPTCSLWFQFARLFRWTQEKAGKDFLKRFLAQKDTITTNEDDGTDVCHTDVDDTGKVPRLPLFASSYYIDASLHPLPS